MRLPLDTIFITNKHGTEGFGHFGKHMGWDLRAAVGTYVYAKASGVVTERYIGQSGTQVVSVRYSDYEHRYLHLSQMNVSVGQKVSEGQIIARTGDSGGVPAHLHEDIRIIGTEWKDSADNYIDPLLHYAKLLTNGGNMAEKLNLATARIFAERVLRRDPAKVHAGLYDDELKKHHVGKDLSNAYVFSLWESKETKAGDIRDLAVIKQAGKVPKLEANLKQRDDRIKSLEKEVESLKAQMGDASKWVTLRALLREFLGIK